MPSGCEQGNPEALPSIAVPQGHQRAFVDYSKYELEGENHTTRLVISNSRPSPWLQDAECNTVDNWYKSSPTTNTDIVGNRIPIGRDTVAKSCKSSFGKRTQRLNCLLSYCRAWITGRSDNEFVTSSSPPQPSETQLEPQPVFQNILYLERTKNLRLQVWLLQCELCSTSKPCTLAGVWWSRSQGPFPERIALPDLRPQ